MLPPAWVLSLDYVDDDRDRVIGASAMACPRSTGPVALGPQRAVAQGAAKSASLLADLGWRSTRWARAASAALLPPRT